MTASRSWSRPLAHGPGPPVPAHVTWEGDLDLASAVVLAAVLSVLRERRCPGVVLDVSRVTFMDCAGLTVLLQYDDRLGDRLSLVEPAPSVLRLLEVAGMARHFRVVRAEHSCDAVRRLDPTVTVEQAKGLIMAAEGCTAAAALERLRATAAGRNVEVRSLARLLVDLLSGGAGRGPAGPGPSAAVVVSRILRPLGVAGTRSARRPAAATHPPRG